MRIGIIIIVLLWALGVNAQTIINSGGATTVYKEQGGRIHDSLMAVPKIDTTRGKAYCSGCRTIGRVVVASDSNLYYYNGVLWKRLSNQSTDTSSLSARINLKADKATTISTTYPLSGGGDLSTNRTFTLDTTLWRSTGYNDTRYSPLAGSTSLTTLGTVTTGTWNGSILAGTYGGTGVNNGSKTLTLSGNTTIGSSTHTVAFATSGNTSVTLPTSGTLITTSNVSGTSGYMARFTGTNTVSTGITRDDGSYVGINFAPTAPYRLTVNGEQLWAGNITYNSGNMTFTSNSSVLSLGNNAWKFNASAGTGDCKQTIFGGGYYYSWYIENNSSTAIRHFGADVISGTAGSERVKWQFLNGSEVLIGGSTSDASALLNIQSTTKGFLPSRMTTAQRTAITASEGLIVYDTDLHKLYCYDGTTWQAAW